MKEEKDKGQPNIKDKRNYGIDLLRILSMFFVVILHILGKGGILKAIENDEVKSAVSYIIYIVAYCAVDCYALITGFVYFSEKDKKIPISKYITLWLQVEFYSIFITLILWQIYPNLVDKKQLVKAVLPVLGDQYWYFSAYTGLFFIIPWLNKIVQNLKKQNIKTIIIYGVILLTTYIMGTSLFKTDPFNLKGGYTFLWLVVLYMIGAYIKKHEIFSNLKIKTMSLLIIFLVFFTWSWKIIIGKLTMNLFGEKIGDDLFIGYLSPTILGIAISFFIIFMKLNISKFWQKMIASISPLVFGVYLIHVQPLVFEKILNDRFIYISNYSAYQIPFIVFSKAIIIFVVGIIIDKIRLKLFELLKVKNIGKFRKENT